jgi:hypothetical protein
MKRIEQKGYCLKMKMTEPQSRMLWVIASIVVASFFLNMARGDQILVGDKHVGGTYLLGHMFFGFLPTLVAVVVQYALGYDAAFVLSLGETVYASVCYAWYGVIAFAVHAKRKRLAIVLLAVHVVPVIMMWAVASLAGYGPRWEMATTANWVAIGLFLLLLAFVVRRIFSHRTN